MESPFFHRMGRGLRVPSVLLCLGIAFLPSCNRFVVDNFEECPKYNKLHLYESPCDEWIGMDRLTRISVAYMEYDEMRDCMITKYTTDQIAAFCPFSVLPGVQPECWDSTVYFANDDLGKCVSFGVDCSGEHHMWENGWDDDYTRCMNKPTCPDGHEELPPREEPW